MKLTHLSSKPAKAAVALGSALLLLLAAAFLPLQAGPKDDVGPEFKHDFESAAAAAQKSGKPMIIIASASWCPPCQQMKSEVYPSKEVQPFHDSFVWAYLDTDDKANAQILSELEVSGIPHIAFLTSDAKAIGQFAGAVSPKKFTELLEQVITIAEDAKDESKIKS